MEFTYSGSICIEENDLNIMARQVSTGGDFDEIFDNVMCGYDERTYWTCDFVKEKVEIEVRKRASETLLFSQFVDSYCFATGGNWTKMIADGIKRAFPNIYLDKVQDMELSFKDLIDILWEDCGVVFD